MLKIRPQNLQNSRLRPAVRRTGKWSAGGETAGTEPERNDRRGTAGGKAADHSALEMPLVTSALFAERNRRGREGRQGRPSAGEVKQESALVTARANVCFIGASQWLR